MNERQPQSQTRDSASTGQSGRGGSAVRQKAIEAYDSARESVDKAGRKASESLDEAPLIALAGGLAAGALIAALLPRTETEKKMLGPVGDKLGNRAREAAEAAKKAGTERLKELGLTPDAGMDTIKSVLKGAGDAAKVSAKAAASTVKGSDQ